jgi:hypothetical protein
VSVTAGDQLTTLTWYAGGEVRVRVQRQVRRLGPNSAGEELSSGAVADSHLGLLVDQPLADTLPAPGSLVVVGPAALLDERVRQPDGRGRLRPRDRPPRPPWPTCGNAWWRWLHLARRCAWTGWPPACSDPAVGLTSAPPR